MVAPASYPASVITEVPVHRGDRKVVSSVRGSPSAQIRRAGRRREGRLLGHAEAKTSHVRAILIKGSAGAANGAKGTVLRWHACQI